MGENRRRRKHESIVALILKGKRQLNRKQMEKLSQRFPVSPAAFF
jgi:hypothetical protein